MTKVNVGLKYEDLMNKIKTYINDKKELNLITKAYNYAKEQHFGVKRMTGEPYIEHPLNVAYILTEINADAATICAGLLHDVLEDCDVTKEEMASNFTDEIANLVDGVTKINKLNFDTSNGSSIMIATQRKILVGLCEDVRVIIIKLADRLHNMRTLWVHPEEKQKEKAIETLEILTPIAHRLGMNKIKSELEDLSLRYYKPDVYYSIVEQLNQSKVERDKVVEEMKNSVSKLLDQNGIKHEIKGRAKSIYSIYKKLDKGKKFNDIYDLLALRVFVETKPECYKALGIIHSKYRPIPKRFKDYIAMPKTNMYQSLHTTVFGDYGYLFEIQIRTYEMDEVAERGIASHWAYKENNGNAKSLMQNNMEQKLQFFRSIIELNSEETKDEDFINSVKEDVFNNTIYVFTPNGDVIELPNGSTPIDFAYKVHTKVGDKMVGAIVNNNIVSIDYKLKNNDIVKINTNQNSFGPSREWVNIVKTNHAKNKIKGFFNRIEKEEYLKNGEDILNKELRKRKLAISEFLSNENVSKILKEYKYDNLDELYISIGNNSIQVGSIINLITEENKDTKEEIILRKTKNKEVEKPQIKNDILVEGIDDIKVNLASCCNPIPQDRIVGYITKGYGITVHRAMCPNVKELEERLVDVKWNAEINKKYPTNLIIHALKKEDLLLNIIAKTTKSNVSIQSINTYINKTDNVYEITVLVDKKENLVKFINDLRQMKDIIEVERLIK
ncbi:MAG: bifunctional (p)ppGpp synthetase/guanosine-3',5'-bis(diphosphate) 3'-pyrophosphohydrolase [Bacilli bacterium]|nr:bifunctional (p)ppGpp synthetase/guanosine-3',5'-bis(diphosphate) 3'-pyrophosphohydrolase [Bacilli bacterium]